MTKRDPLHFVMIVVAAGLIATGCGGGSKPSPGAIRPLEASEPPATAAGALPTVVSRPPRVGVGGAVITACVFPEDQRLGPEATITVTNNTPTPSNYVIKVGFNTKDEVQAPLDAVAVTVTGLAPGQVTEQKASSSKSELRGSIIAAELLCKVLQATRSAA